MMGNCRWLSAFTGAGSMPHFHMKNYGMNALSEEHGFLVVYPQGQEAVFLKQYLPQWDAYFGTGTNDKKFIVDLIDYLMSPQSMRTAIGFIWPGFSNGGLMTLLGGCELSHRVAAVASVAGQLSYSQQQKLQAGAQCTNFLHARHERRASANHGCREIFVPLLTI